MNKWVALVFLLTWMGCLKAEGISAKATSVVTDNTYYVEITVFSRSQAFKPLYAHQQGILQIEAHPKDTLPEILYSHPDFSFKDSLAQSLFFKLDEPTRVVLSFITTEDTLYSQPFRIGPSNNTFIVTPFHNRIRVQSSRYLFPTRFPRTLSYLLFLLIAISSKLLLSGIALIFLRKNWKIILVALVAYLLSSNLVLFLPLSILCSILLSILIETIWITFVCKRWINFTSTLIFVLLVNIGSWGLIHLTYRILLFL